MMLGDTSMTLSIGVASLMLVEYGRPMNIGALSLKSRMGISRRNETVFGSVSDKPSSAMNR